MPFYREMSARVALSCALLLPALISTAGCKERSAVKNSPEQSAVKKISGPISYVALGDSTGAGVGASEGGYVVRLFRRLTTLRPGSKLTNLCVSGATTAGVLRTQLPSALRTQANLITLGIGINDIGHGVEIDEFGRNYETILQRLTTERPDAAIVVTNIPDVSPSPRIPPGLRAEYHRRIVEFNQKLEEVAARYAVTVFDIYSVTHKELPQRPEFFSSDGFHPSDEGYETWAEQMWPAVDRAIGGAE